MAVTYQDVVRANGAAASWALTETSGTSFAPWLGATNLVGSSINTYQGAGPFATAFSVKLNVAGSMRLPFARVVFPPVTQEVWVKANALPVTTYQLILRAGVTGTNGNGFYIDPTANAVFYTSVPGSAISTGYIWPDLNWHLVQWVSEPGNLVSLYVDGAIVWRSTITTPTAPSPNTLGFGNDGSADNSKNVWSISYPAWYPLALTPTSAYATFLAATDPATALGYATGGAGAAAAVNSATLAQLIGYVSRTYQNTP